MPQAGTVRGVRHLRSIVYALVLGPAVWILCGVGFYQDLTGRARDNGGIESLSGVLLLLLAGSAYAILLLSPISPAGPLVAGLALLGVGAWARISPDSYAGVWPAAITKAGFNLSTPGYGLVVLLAVPLLCTALSARRWRAFEPPEILLIGTIGRARGAAQVAGTPMASERTTVIPQQRQGPGFVPGFGQPESADTTQIVAPGRPGVTRPSSSSAAFDDDGEEKTTVMRLGRPFPEAAGPTQIVTPPAEAEPTQIVRPAAEAEPTQIVTPVAEEATEVLGADDGRTEDLAATDETTRDLVASGATPPDETTRDVTADETTRDVTADEATREVTADEATREVTADEVTREVTADETTRDVVASGAAPDPAEDETTRLSLPVVADAQATEAFGAVAADGEEKTELLTLPKAAGRTPGTTERGEQTQVIRPGTVQPPGDRTQLLTFPTPSEAPTVATPVADDSEAAPSTKAMSIVAAERPDPGEDPTTRLTTPVKPPAEATTRPGPERRAMTATNLERPADEAADDTRPLTLPVQRPPADDDAIPSR